MKSFTHNPYFRSLFLC